MPKPPAQTRCPWPECDHRFEVDDEHLGRTVRCPRCAAEMTARPLAAWEAMARRRAALDQGQLERLLRLEGLGGGSPRRQASERLYQRDPTAPHEQRRDAQYEAGTDHPRPRLEPADELLVVLDDIRSQWNAGAILRTAEAAGFGRAAMAGITPLPVARGVQRVALGADQSVAWAYEPRIVLLLRRLVDAGYEPVALEQTDDAIPLDRFSPSRRVALVVGSEVGGVSRETLALCPRRVQIPLAGRKASLNVAVAFGVAAFTLAPRWRERFGPPQAGMTRNC